MLPLVTFLGFAPLGMATVLVRAGKPLLPAKAAVPPFASRANGTRAWHRAARGARTLYPPSISLAEVETQHRSLHLVKPGYRTRVEDPTAHFG